MRNPTVPTACTTRSSIFAKSTARSSCLADAQQRSLSTNQCKLCVNDSNIIWLTALRVTSSCMQIRHLWKLKMDCRRRNCWQIGEFPERQQEWYTLFDVVKKNWFYQQHWKVEWKWSSSSSFWVNWFKHQVDWWPKPQQGRTTKSFILGVDTLWLLLVAKFSCVLTLLKCRRYLCF